MCRWGHCSSVLMIWLAASLDRSLSPPRLVSRVKEKRNALIRWNVLMCVSMCVQNQSS